MKLIAGGQCAEHWPKLAPTGAHWLLHMDAVKFCESPAAREVTHVYMFDSLWDEAVSQSIGDHILGGDLPALLSIVTYSRNLAYRLRGDGPWKLDASQEVKTSEGEEPQDFCDAPKQVRCGPLPMSVQCCLGFDVSLSLQSVLGSHLKVT